MSAGGGVIRVPRGSGHRHDVEPAIAIEILEAEDRVAGAGATDRARAVRPADRGAGRERCAGGGAPNRIAHVAERLAGEVGLDGRGITADTRRSDLDRV